MTATKTPLSEILKSQRYAIKIINIKQVIDLIPDCPILEDLELFFSVDPNHTEFVGTVHSIEKGFHLGFVHRDNKQIINFEELEYE